MIEEEKELLTKENLSESIKEAKEVIEILIDKRDSLKRNYIKMECKLIFMQERLFGLKKHLKDIKERAKE